MRLVSHKQIYTTPINLIPTAILSDPSEKRKGRNRKAVVFISSPFALVKESILSFLKNIPVKRVEFYFGANSDIITQNNMSGQDYWVNSDTIVSPLKYISEILKNSLNDPLLSISSFSFCLNAIPLCYRSTCDSF